MLVGTLEYVISTGIDPCFHQEVMCLDNEQNELVSLGEPKHTLIMTPDVNYTRNECSFYTRNECSFYTRNKCSFQLSTLSFDPHAPVLPSPAETFVVPSTQSSDEEPVLRENQGPLR